MTRQVFDTAQVAHVWAQGRQEEGRNPARRVFFDGPRLFSYGRHFLTAYRLPDGAAFLNSDRYSVSTSRHQSDARHAVRGRGYPMPGKLLEGVADLLQQSVFRIAEWNGSRSVFREATPAEQKAARIRLLKLFLDAKETAPAESIVAAFRYAGAKPEEAAKAAARVTAAHEKRAKEEAAADLKRAKEGAASDAKAAAARPLSDFAAAVQEARADLKRHNYRGAWERAAADLLDKARRLFKARKEAKARGWIRIAADLKARESILRAGAAGLEAYSVQCARVTYWQERKARIRVAIAALADHEGAAAFGKSEGRGSLAYAWQQARQAAEALLKDVRGAALYPQGDESESFSAGLARAARLMGADLPGMAAGLESMVAAFQGAENRANAETSRATRRAQVAALRAFLVAPEEATAEVAEKAAKAAGAYARVRGYTPSHGGPEIGGYRPAIPGAFALAGFTSEAFRAIHDKARARVTAARAEELAADLAAWRDGGRLPGRQSDAEGGALLRARDVKRDESGAIVGGTLETSHGASVPLTHALRAFRFLKLCRDTGREWRANGKTLPVGHFRIDLVDKSGGFRAGCHRINWPEVAALAARLGVADLAPADTTEAREGVHA